MLVTFHPTSDMQTHSRKVTSIDLNNNAVQVSAGVGMLRIVDEHGNETVITNGKLELMSQIAAACIDATFNSSSLETLQDAIVDRCRFVDEAIAKAES